MYIETVFYETYGKFVYILASLWKPGDLGFPHKLDTLKTTNNL